MTAYGVQVGLPMESPAFVHQLRTELEALAAAVDVNFLTNTAVWIVDGEPVLRRLTKRSTPGMLKTVERLIAARLKPVNILDISPTRRTGRIGHGPLVHFRGKRRVWRPHGPLCDDGVLLWL